MWLILLSSLPLPCLHPHSFSPSIPICDSLPLSLIFFVLTLPTQFSLPFSRYHLYPSISSLCSLSLSLCLFTLAPIQLTLSTPSNFLPYTPLCCLSLPSFPLLFSPSCVPVPLCTPTSFSHLLSLPQVWRVWTTTPSWWQWLEFWFGFWWMDTDRGETLLQSSLPPAWRQEMKHKVGDDLL